MPELIWKGKEQVINHHQDVPVRSLDCEYTYNGDEESGNKIIHGDNLAALKALLSQYEGRVKCIYIDPPYNTGNESWVYNDNVKDPRIVKWLGEVVGKEGEDLCRHDKWLCMMYPRLQLLKRLLADDGVILISIDDNEQSHLCAIMNEIFGINNYVTSLSWQKRVSPANDAKYFSSDHEFVLVYSKNKMLWRPNRLERTESQLKNYRNPDDDPRGPWNSVTYTCNKSASERPNLYHSIINAISGKEVLPKKTAVWKYDAARHKKNEEQGLVYWGVNGKAKMPRLKRFLSDMGKVVPRSTLAYSECGHTQEARLELLNIITDSPFTTPKPTRLIEYLLNIGSNKDSIILDSFAGSGTTAHAVLNLNKKDGGNRKFILIEMMEYAETITAERVKRVIEGYGKEKKAVEGTGGIFSYYTLGERVFDDEGNLNESLGIAKIRNYVAWTERLPGAENRKNPYWLGKKDRIDYYFYYEPEQLTVLNLEFLATLDHKGESYLIYADVCLLDESFMAEKHIRFKKIPRDISRF